MKIAIATTSELKVRALKNALIKFNIEHEVIPIKTDSKVSSQPFGYEETTLGAKNRVDFVVETENPDIAVAVESGLIEIGGSYFDIACVYIRTKDGEDSVSYSSGYFVPKWIIEEIKENKTELGFITKRLSGNTDKDPLKYFSDGQMKREDVLSQAIEIALIKIINKDKYKK
jgi:inosine/xanthosine triphosphatase